MHSTFTFVPLKRFVFLAAAGLCCLTARSEGAMARTMPLTHHVIERITGKILDETGAPLPGATVVVKGTNNGVVTNVDGDFAIEAENGSTLLVSYVGYVTKEVQVNASVLEVRLDLDAAHLEEVVLIGYGDQTRADVTGSLTQIKAENFRQGINTSPDNLIQGKVAGVRVVNSSGEPGAGMDVVIRGVGSIRSGSTPLFVVDGVPLTNDNVSAPGADMGMGSSTAKNPLNFLNTNDIASINVLKDASAAAIYGARGANGVIIITTKKGVTGQGTLTADSYVGISQVAKKYDLLTADEYREAIKTPGVNRPANDHLGNTDWQDVIMRTAVTNNQSLSFAKATASGDYYASLSHMYQEGIVGNANFSRTTARINASESFLDDERLKVGVHLTASETRDRSVPTSDEGGANGQLITQMLMANPTFPVHAADGSFTNFNGNQYYNPAYLLSIYDDVTTTTRILGNIETSFRILKGLEYKFNLGIDRSVGERNATIYPNLTADINPNGRYSRTDIDSKNTLLEHYLTYGTSFNRHKIDLLAGFSYQKFDRSSQTWGLTGIAAQDQGVPPTFNPAYKGLPTAPSGYSQANELQSYFGRVNYTFNDRYLLTASMRADGSTRFGKNNKYGYFPSFAAGWIITKEDFLPASDLLTNLKLRASWGQTGNQDVQNKITQASYSTSGAEGYYLYNDLNLVNGLAIARTINPNLKWEVSTQTDIGLDFSLLQGRLYGTVDYFNKVTSQAILFVPAPALSPTTNVWTNIDGKIINRGIELMLGYQIVNAGKLKWSIDGNGATLHNEIQDLPVSAIYSGVISGPGLTDNWANIYTNGQPVGAFYLKEFVGFDEAGKEIIKDQNNDTQINNSDRVVSHGALPTFSYGLNTQVTFGAFDLSLAFIGQSGGYLVNNTSINAVNLNNLQSDRNASMDYYQSGASPSVLPSLSSRYMESSNFFRLNSARVGYTFKSGRVSWLDNATLYVTGQNIFTITNYSGFDPLMNSPKPVGGNLSLGIDYPRFPTARTFTMGITLKI